MIEVQSVGALSVSTIHATSLEFDGVYAQIGRYSARLVVTLSISLLLMTAALSFFHRYQFPV